MLKKKLPSLNDCKALGGHFGRPKPPKRGPRGSQNLPKWTPKRQKIEVQKQGVFRLDFFMDFIGFLMVFWMIFKSKHVTKLPKTILAKTSKIVLPSRRNAKFQEIEVTKKKTIKHKSMKNRIFFGTSILSRFGTGFGGVLGGQKPLFLLFFRIKIDGKKA